MSNKNETKGESNFLLSKLNSLCYSLMKHTWDFTLSYKFLVIFSLVIFLISMMRIDLSMTKNVVITLSVIVAVVTGLYGFIKWKLEYLGKEKYHAALELLISCKYYCDSIRYLRSPFMFSSEYQTKATKKTKISDCEGHMTDIQFAYEKRWEKVNDASLDLRKAMIRAEIICNEDLSETRAIIVRNEKQIYNALYRHLYGSSDDLQARNKRMLKDRDIVYDSLDKEDIIEPILKSIYDNLYVQVEPYLVTKLQVN